MVDVVNVVASGSLDKELDLNAVARELDDIADYDPDKYPGVYLRLSGSKPLITLYRTGKYIITGASSETDSRKTRDELLHTLHDHDILPQPVDEWFSVQNYVCIGDIQDRLNLSALAIGLGLENTEYEPEQFPGLVYRPPRHDCVLLAFGSGKVVITGANGRGAAERAFKTLQGRVDELF